MKRFTEALALGLSALVLCLPSGAAHARITQTEKAPVQGARANARDIELAEVQTRVAKVTVTLPHRSCAGAVVGSPTQVLTAAHCVPEGAETLAVTHQGRRLEAVVALIDRTRDTALLALDEELAVEPLSLDVELPEPGDRVFFVGRVDRPLKPQRASVRKIGRCPSLPGVSDALFTSIQARPGDSGAPVVNEEQEVVGIIHGGAACHIAAPTATLARSLSPYGRADSTAPAIESQQPAKEYRLGPFVLEKFQEPNGFRYRFSFRLGSSS